MYLYLLILESQKTKFSGKLLFIPIVVSSQKIDHNGKGPSDLRVKTRFMSRSYSSVSNEHVKRIQDEKITLGE